MSVAIQDVHKISFSIAATYNEGTATDMDALKNCLQ